MASSVDAFITEIKNEIRRDTANAVAQSKAMSYKQGQDEFKSFYEEGGQPTVYERTGKLYNSFKQMPAGNYINMASDIYEYTLYIEEPFYGPSPNGNREKFEDEANGIRSTMEGYKVVNAANRGNCGILGKPGFWDRTLILTEKNFNNCMKMAFN